MKRVTINQAAKILKSGRIAVYPTETAYALGADARSRAAVLEIYRLKGRDRKKPLALIAASLNMVRRNFALQGAAERLALRFWPGPLTLILPIRERKIIKALKIKEAGVRVSPHRVARALSRAIGGPIVATSANQSGRANSYSAKSAARAFKNQIPVVDAGRIPRRPSSTVVAFRRDQPIVLRPGPVKITDS
jgi:L-threonylcarbamoyladenylate synthase